MAEHLRHQFMLATPEPGKLGSNPYRRPRISLSGLFVGFIAGF
jgi:hypothetical protein